VGDRGGGDSVQVAAAVIECDGEGDVVDVGGLVAAGGGAGIGSVGGILTITTATFDDGIGIGGVGAVKGVGSMVRVTVAVVVVVVGGRISIVEGQGQVS